MGSEGLDYQIADFLNKAFYVVQYLVTTDRINLRVKWDFLMHGRNFCWKMPLLRLLVGRADC